MQVIQTESRGMGLFGQEQYDLPEIVPDKAIIRISRETPEGEPNQFLQQQKILLLVVIELMEGIQLIGGLLQPQNQIIGQQLYNILIKRLILLVTAIRLYQHMLQTILRAVLGVDDQIPEELVHVWLEDIAEVDRVVDLGED